MIGSWAPRIGRTALGAVFVWAGAAKWMDPAEGTFYWLAIGKNPLSHHLFCAGEVSLGLWLLSGWRTDCASAISAIAFSLFAGMIAFNLFRDRPIPCGCGFLAQQGSVSKIRRDLFVGLGANIVFLALACWLAGLFRARKQPV